MKLEIGQIVHVRSRQYLVEEVTPAEIEEGDTLVRLSCMDDDAQGEQLEIFWERELDAKLVGASSWETVTEKGFDNPRYFSAFLHTLKWNCVTSTDPRLFQAPYRAGIEVKAYQLEPLRKALLQPRVSLFIADDVGLGKTIEAGLILREMLMRQKIKRVVIACPPSVVRQWQEEMESRFGLIFQIFDRDYLAAKRRERGYNINPWTMHTRFIISHALLRDETYASLLRDWLGDFNSGSLLILDEAHNAAPASSSRYAIDSRLTRMVRDLAPRFEHKLFLSATPHNGHSNSFAALLEILDPQRFCRGVPVTKKQLLDEVMVRRLKQDLREIGDKDFPDRQIIPIIIDDLPPDAPELVLGRLLQDYRACREEHLQDAPKSTQTAAILVMTSLQKRLLSCVEAFGRTLSVHRKSLERQAEKQSGNVNSNFSLLRESPGADDDRSELPENEVEIEEDAQMATATQLSTPAISERELELLEAMSNIVNQARHQPDSRVEKLIEWIREHLCADLGQPGAKWSDRRVLIFTEYTDTKRYLEEQLRRVIAHSEREHDRIETFTGGMGDERRESIKAAFNSDPQDHPLRILIATDAAREGVNLQNYCADLFHFDVPWNPSRMEQRNGRIDRKLQKQSIVRCYYFCLPQRLEDRVIDVLIKKTATISRELGTLSPVIERKVENLLSEGIRAHDEQNLVEAIQRADQESLGRNHLIQEELEGMRLHRQKLREQQTILEDMLHDSKRWLGLDNHHFRDSLSAALEILGANPLQPLDAEAAVRDIERALWILPNLFDSTWAITLDTLREPRQKGQKLWNWRKETPIRPVVFRDPGTLDGKVVHIHLEHRVVQRLLGRFLSQGFLHHELTRACVCLTEDSIPKVIVLGRLSLYGAGASRLHDEIVAVAAQWLTPEARGRGKLRPLGEGEKADVLTELEHSLATVRLREIPSSLPDRFKEYAPRDIEDLVPHLEKRAQTLRERAERKLTQRGEKEAAQMKKLLEEQKERILKQQEQTQNLQLDLFNSEEIRQIEADRRHWRLRLQQLETEIETEPTRVQQTYQIKASRVEPVGLIYLWPVSS
ncbi:DISARM system SNF2-like helicase DrmD [Gloeocapsa sp. PCC 73106]|uniref:DISARM system SNF2-like helicase DrmD n=1 Tax=Gloeocapsa sp. PCC 73106 TaxID=102232 RepID=UPI0002ACAC03|nr:DISARM system SNF2-like helicase DrmD [Gloeocapsa sp. PCC 73106]ELR96872.1 DNA/RNA helicase, superfamily II, SNF2 family [Gloeocapsa sp. PCC 73106]